MEGDFVLPEANDALPVHVDDAQVWPRSAMPAA
ncbi:hypothetical protein BH18CHL2_BH18CHL2_12670 [soil metagenome]